MRGVCAALAVALTACAGVPAPRSASLPSVASPAAGPVAVGRQAVELVTDGEEAVRRLVMAVAGAQSSVHAEIYEFDRPEIVDAMIAARLRGVAVVVIGDATVAVNARTFDRLRAAGAIVLLFPDGPMQIDHVKLLVIDGRVAVFGGMNWGSGSYRNHDFDLVISGSAVSRLETLFGADRVRSGQESARPEPSGPDPPGLSLLTTYPGDEVRPAVLSALSGAGRYVFVEMYVMTDGQVMAALGNAARRGVDVWVLFDPNQDLNQAAAARLRDAGVRARFYRTSGEKLHAKAMVVDGRALVVGSANWTSSGFTRNHELDAVIDSEPLAEEALARMESDWNASG